MATHRQLFSLSILLGVLAITATARPCKTLFFFATTSYYPIDPNPTTLSLHNPNSNSNPSNGPRFLTFFFTEVREFHPSIAFPSYDSIVVNPASDVEKRPLPLEFYASVRNSIRDRTKDIMSVVGALLFGVGCGALTAATMYLMWSLFPANRFEFRDSDDDFEDGDDEDDVTPKKMGYISIPSADLVKPPSAKEDA